MTYRAEPVPLECPELLSEYLDRQFLGIDAHLSKFTAPVVGDIPDRRQMGAIVYVREQGFFGCVESDGVLEWTKLNL